MSLRRMLAALVFAAAAGPVMRAAQVVAPARAPYVVVMGCVQKESTVLAPDPKSHGADMDKEFVLTFSVLSPDLQQSELPKPAADASGMPGYVGAVYRLTGRKEGELKQFVGQRIEVTGSFKDKDKAAAAMKGAKVGRAGQLTPDDTPEIIIDTYRLVSEVCSPPVK